MYIHAIRPRSFLSQLRIGVGVFLYKKFGCRLLVDVLSSLGVSASYKEIRHYETSAIKQPDRAFLPSAFS